uniref:Uncharacterized protein n=1 Tax=Setaria viridis TaxID=4556 RepID=A0A4U6U655_SETVI|nr:hypothetical protein SEVIR_6G076600v2 [Setaria viridis]
MAGCSRGSLPTWMTAAASRVDLTGGAGARDVRAGPEEAGGRRRRGRPEGAGGAGEGERKCGRVTQPVMGHPELQTYHPTAARPPASRMAARVPYYRTAARPLSSAPVLRRPVRPSGAPSGRPAPRPPRRRPVPPAAPPPVPLGELGEIPTAARPLHLLGARGVPALAHRPPPRQAPRPAVRPSR